MRRIDIDAFVDTSIPDQPRVALLLVGITAVPRLPTIRLTPQAPDSETTADGQWPEGDLLPMEVRMTDDGAEIFLGADIVECPTLLPGTAIELELPDLRLKGAFLWPHVPVASRARRRSVVARRPVLAPVPRPPIVSRDVATSPLPQPAEPVRSLRPQAQRPPMPRAEPVTQHAVAQVPAAPADVQRQQIPQHFEQIQPIAQEPAGKLRETTSRPGRATAAAQSAGAFAWQTDAAAPSPTPEPLAPTMADTSSAPVKQDATVEPRSGQPRSGQPSSGRPTGRTWAGRAAFAGMVLASVLLIETALLAFRGLPAGADAVMTGRSQRSPASNSTDLKLLELLQTPALSPRGVAARETSPDKLLALASASLHGQGSARDGEEGAYWLKRYVIASLGDERMLRALTQLGSTFAEPASGQADYARARHLWEFAGNLGDPVAMCFLGALFEHGLGVTAERKFALQWYARAKSAGGCPNVEEAIARVMP